MANLKFCGFVTEACVSINCYMQAEALGSQKPSSMIPLQLYFACWYIELQAEAKMIASKWLQSHKPLANA